MQAKSQQNSDIVLFSQYKNCLLRLVPPDRGGVWCDTPVSNVKTIYQMSLLYTINMEVPTLGDSLS